MQNVGKTYGDNGFSCVENMRHAPRHKTNSDPLTIIRTVFYHVWTSYELLPGLQQRFIVLYYEYHNNH